MGIFVDHDKWDANPDLLPNGVLKISNRELLPHSPNYYFTTWLPYHYDPQAECPTYLSVLERAIPDEMEFFQEFAGYALTSDTRHEIAIWLVGPPASGKSTALLGLETMLGPRAGTLGLKEIERSRFALTN